MWIIRQVFYHQQKIPVEPEKKLAVTLRPVLARKERVSLQDSLKR
jgi:hypothetical protein